MVGLIDPQATQSFEFSDAQVLGNNRYLNGTKVHTGANGDVPILNGNFNGTSPSTHTSTNDASTNGDSYESARYTLPQGQSSAEPIAIIGMGCRLPGGCSSSSKLWDFLVAGRSAQGPFPKSRFNIDGFYHPNGERPGSLNTEGGYFIEEDIRSFENSMFGINNLEATFMDPQQRKLLEVVFETFENAGLSLEQLSGSSVGCYVGNFVTDFITMQLKDAEYTHRYTATGLGTTILANRISHVFNLKGPSFVIDTACSSSLYCLHAACSALLAGDCDSAVVAGANLIQSPEQQLATMKAGVLSKTSTCHTFDASADGYGRADGIGALLVKRLSDAIRDGDPVRAVIRGTAVNSNGRTNGITLPSADGQEAVIRKAYAQAGLGYDETDYVECHGTGTAVGDPIEVEATSRVFRRPHSSPPLLIGSVKTNLGHSEAASGITSIIKVVLALEKGVIPPTVGVKNVNPKIKLDEWNIDIVTKATDWPSNSPHNINGRVRRAGVSSFDYGGANSHVIIDASHMHIPSDHTRSSSEEVTTALERSKMMLPFSANSSTALYRRVTDISTLKSANVNTVDLAYTLGVKRSQLPVRGYILARSGHQEEEDLSLENLRTRIEGKSYSRLPLTFVFTGQGAQWPGMGRGLLAEYPTFRQTIQMFDSVLQLLPHPPNWTLLGTLLEPEETSMINHASRSQPICTAVQVALIKLLSKFGIKPHSVIGHSSGEIAAAYASGHVTDQEAIVIAYYRGYTVTHSCKATIGAMMAAGLGRADAEERIMALGLESNINVACVNSPESVTISGDIDCINRLKTSLDSQGIFARVLKTDGKAYHSHHMTAMGEEYEQHLTLAEAILNSMTSSGSFISNAPATWISSVSGKTMDQGRINLSYWRKNLESPVLFENVVEKLLKDFRSCHLVEIGPHSALELPIKQTYTKLNISKDKVYYNTALSRGKDSVTSVLSLVGDLYLHGHTILFKEVNVVGSWLSNPKARLLPKRQQVVMLLDLPGYYWDYDQRQELFRESRSSIEWRNRKHPHHDLLGSQVHGGNGIVNSWRNVLKAKHVPWIEGHKLDSTIVVPAAGYLAMAVEAISQIKGVSDMDNDKAAFKLQDIHVIQALLLPQDDGLDSGIEVFTTLEPARISGSAATEWYRFNISSYAAYEATTHATGLIQLIAGSELDTTSPLPEVSHDDVEPTAPRVWYNKFVEGGLNFQDSFQSLEQVHVHTKRQNMSILAKAELRQGGGSGTNAESKYVIHPITIDTLFQAGIIAHTSGMVRSLMAKLPVHIEQVMLKPPTAGQSAASKDENLNIKAVSEPVGFGTIRVSGELYDDNGSTILRISRCRLVAYQSGIQKQAEDERHPMLRVLWKPDITQLSPDNAAEFSSYIQQYEKRAAESKIFNATTEVQETVMARLAAVVDLLVHKNPRLQILSFLGDDRHDDYLAYTLRLTTNFKRCFSLWRASYTDSGTLQFQEYSSESKPPQSDRPKSSFDLVILGPNKSGKVSNSLKELVMPGGALLFPGSSGEACSLKELGYEEPLQSQLGGPYEVILARIPLEETSGQEMVFKREQKVLVVERNADHALNVVLADHIEQTTGFTVHRIAFQQVTPELVRAHNNVIATLELDDALLSCITENDMRLVKILTDNCANLVWVTGGQLLQGMRPELGIAYGLARALMLEQPSLRFFVVDVDVEATSLPADIDITARHVLDVMIQAINAPEPDFEFIHARRMLHVSRFVPAETLNSTFREKQGAEKKILPQGEAQPFRLDTEIVGQTDSIFFRQQEATTETLLPTGHVEVAVKAVGLSSRDLDAISGKIEDGSDTTCASQYSAIVTRVGEGVKGFVAGDRVVVMAPGHLATLEHVPKDSCYKLKDKEDFKSMASLPLPLSTAIYAINDRARLQANESILIHCNSRDAHGGAIVAAIAIGRKIAAQVYALCSSLEDGERLVRVASLPQERVFSISDNGMLKKLLDATDSRGFDAVVSFDNDHIDAAIFADCARLVQVGSGVSCLAATLAANPSALNRNITLSTFNMGSLIARQTPGSQALRQRLLADAVELHRSGDLGDLDLSPRVWDIGDTAEAFRALAQNKPAGINHTRGTVISLENEESTIPVMPIKYDTRLSPKKTYLLVGCLGGLGRSMSKWMLSRGARKFVFMGRSGTDKAPARRLVENLLSLGAEVTVIRGDVVNADDVKRAVTGIDGPVGGVIQAAMGLDEALFTTMSRDYWLAGLRPKVVGSWNLYNALSGREHDLDFFLMTSSVSGSVGTATESNYCSANYFLDVFARHCRRSGIPAISVGLGMISEVGYLHENPEIEALLLRKGIQAINEDEMLQIIDISLSSVTSTPIGPDNTYDDFALGHVLTGLEPLGLKALRAKGFEGSSPVLGDPRASLLSAALDESSAGANISSSANGLAAEVAEAIAAGSSVEGAVLQTISHKFSSLVLISMDKLDATKPISSVGVDSMLAAEFRAWIFQAFKVDIPYMTLLSPVATLTMLSETVAQKIMESH